MEKKYIPQPTNTGIQHKTQATLNTRPEKHTDGQAKNTQTHNIMEIRRKS